MSQQRVENLRRLYAALARGDTQGVIERLHPTAELHQPPESPGASSYYGRDEVARGTTDFLSAWDDFTFEPREVSAIGDAVLMNMLLTGRGKGSGVEVTMSVFHAWTFRDGQPHRLFVCMTREDALEAAGLGSSALDESEQRPTRDTG
jgi:ketosteroid isomerase-like protein